MTEIIAAIEAIAAIVEILSKKQDKTAEELEAYIAMREAVRRAKEAVVFDGK